MRITRPKFTKVCESWLWSWIGLRPYLGQKRINYCVDDLSYPASTQYAIHQLNQKESSIDVNDPFMDGFVVVLHTCISVQTILEHISNKRNYWLRIVRMVTKDVSIQHLKFWIPLSRDTIVNILQIRKLSD